MLVCEVSKGPHADNIHVENIVPYFQPITDIKHNVVWGYECLARLIDQGQKVWLPSDFLYLLKRDTCFGDLTRKIFHSSAQYFRNVQVNWSINITERDVLNSQTIGFLEHYLAEYPNSHRVMLEISANTLLNYSVQCKAFLLLGKMLDLQILIDRFDDPLAQLPRVLDFPIDGVKIDSKRLLDEESEEAFAQIQEKARKNHIAVIAEQIENVDILKRVNTLDIQYGQGFFIRYPQSDVVQ
jgi:EAL domain-containing protein (putative c-di-GMP-specific phosphodiesterase class I)